MQPKYLERDGLRDSVVEVYFKNTVYQIEHIVNTILAGGDMNDYNKIEDINNHCIFLHNDVFRIQVKTDCVSFNNIKEYQRWPSYGPFIKKVIERVLSLNDISVTGQTIRYISIYPQVSIFDNLNGKKMVLNAVPPIDGTEIRFTMGITDAQNHRGIATIRITDNLPSNNSGVKVSVVDIQIYSEANNGNQEQTLEFLHTQERNLFFSILDKKFIESLGAHY